MDSTLPIILPTLAIAILLNLLFRQLKLPTIFGYLSAGAIVTAFFGLDPASNHTLHEIAEMGIVFLMFTIGLEFSIPHLMAMRREVLIFGGFQVMVTSVLFGLIAHFGFSIDARAAILIGAALALSSTAIVYRFLNENREIDKPYGRYCLGILLFQDLAVIPILLMIKLFTNSDHSIPLLLLQTAGGAVIAFAVLLIVGKYMLAKFLALVTDSRTHELFVGTILLIVVSAAYLTHFLGLSYSLGAFLSGLMIAETKFKYQVEADLTPFRDLLLGLFFVTVGMQIQASFLLAHLLEVIILTASLMLLKAIVVLILVRFSQPLDTSVKAALALAQGGGFSFAVFASASNNGLLEANTSQLLTIVVVISMVLTPFILKNLDRLSHFFEKELDNDTPMKEPTFENNQLVVCGADACTTVNLERNHLVVCGYGKLGQNVMQQLKELDYPRVAIDHNQQIVQEGINRGDAVIFGNAAQRTILEKAWVNKSAAVIIALEDAQAIRLVSEAVASMVETPLIVVRVSGMLERELFKDIPIKSFVEEYREVGQILIDHALTCELVKPYVPKVCRMCEPELGKASEQLKNKKTFPIVNNLAQ